MDTNDQTQRPAQLAMIAAKNATTWIKVARSNLDRAEAAAVAILAECGRASKALQELEDRSDCAQASAARIVELTQNARRG